MTHNKHLQQPTIERSKGAAKGIYYRGVAATASDFILIAPDIETLSAKWSIFTDQPLNEDKCVAVGLFSQNDVQDLST